MPVTGSLQIILGFNERKTSGVLGDGASYPVSLNTGVDKYTSGTDKDQCDTLYAVPRTLAGSANENLDLSGALTSAFGSTIANVEVVALVVLLDNDGERVRLATSGTNGWTTMLNGTLDVRGKGGFVNYTKAAAAFTVTAGTGDIINVLNQTASSVTYKIGIVGRTA